jgi:hypothetical protein
MNKSTEFFSLFLGVILALVGLALIMAIPTWFLWNRCLVPAVNGVNPIGILQAIGINFLFSILFKSTSFVSNKNG